MAQSPSLTLVRTRTSHFTVAAHAELRERIDAYLRQKGLTDDERARVLARSVCPFCGGPLA